jgi:hypothetical protein
MSEKNRIIPLEEVLFKFNAQNKEFIKNIDKQERLERVETLEVVLNDIKGMEHTINVKKKNFINELKGGLGEKVKQNPTRIKKIEKTFSQKTKLFIKNIFTRF